ncbi:hypothetical protein HPB49_020541 [Dermacentor silvarum]|uniref:Uncharacterized protein n=1 Tax=Dermacentor silvarum TaxID=543639 RepID=A0ACB8D7V7_DERSI|nr:hypothetical protein HPB49_020541 [Dermacentor silvarum]
MKQLKLELLAGAYDAFEASPLRLFRMLAVSTCAAVHRMRLPLINQAIDMNGARRGSERPSKLRQEVNGCTSAAARGELAVFEPGGQQFRAPGVNEARGPARRDVRGKVRRIAESNEDEGVRGSQGSCFQCSRRWLTRVPPVPELLHLSCAEQRSSGTDVAVLDAVLTCDRRICAPRSCWTRRSLDAAVAAPECAEPENHAGRGMNVSSSQSARARVNPQCRDDRSAHLKENATAVIPKQVSHTQWSARADATRALVAGSKEVKAALMELSEDHDERAETKHEANSLLKAMTMLETALMTEFWDRVAQSLNATSKAI